MEENNIINFNTRKKKDRTTKVPEQIEKIVILQLNQEEVNKILESLAIQLHYLKKDLREGEYIQRGVNKEIIEKIVGEMEELINKIKSQRFKI